MISALTGNINRIAPSSLYLQAGAVEYEVHVPLSVLEELESQGQFTSVRLFIYHYFSGNEQRLYGFLDPLQREFFGNLQSVKGCGPALALSLLSHLDAARIIKLCNVKDVAALCRVPRVGKATAERLIFEINRRKKKWDRLFDLQKQHTSEQERPAFSQQQELALQALIQLGYRESTARAAVERATEEISLAGQQTASNTAEWIRCALRSI